ncbi:MAG: hypothetical protein ACU826_02685 [Gammaproteobacteria bacterium]
MNKRHYVLVLIFTYTILICSAKAQQLQPESQSLLKVPVDNLPKGVVLAKGIELYSRDQRTSLEDAPDYKPYTEGVLIRPVFQTTTPDGAYRVSNLSLLVALDKKSSSFSLPGAAVITLRSGKAVIAINDESAEMEIGDTISLDAGASINISTIGYVRPVSFDVVLVQKN